MILNVINIYTLTEINIYKSFVAYFFMNIILNGIYILGCKGMSFNSLTVLSVSIIILRGVDR